MSDFKLQYRSFVLVEDLQPNECTIHRVTAPGVEYWHMWFYVARETDGVLEAFAVPIAPNENFNENGPGGRTWGFYHVDGAVGSSALTWAVTPSINVTQGDDAKEIHAGVHATLPSLWHKTPTVEGVPDGERWAVGGAR